MTNQHQRGIPPNRTSPRVRTSVSNLYEVGPLRLRERTLKTIKAYVNRQHLRHNATLLKRYCDPAVRLCAVVKADAYGHHAPAVVSLLADDCADYFAVSTIEEAEQIYPFTLGKPVLVASPLFVGLDPELIRLAHARHFQCTICSRPALEYVNAVLVNAGQPLDIHLKVDTGMGRLGCRLDEAGYLVQALQQSHSLNLTGVYTHFATADDPDLAFTHQQLQNFETFLAQSQLCQRSSVLKHTCNTAATLRLPQAHLDMVRCGIGLYGYAASEATSAIELDFRPVLKVQAPVVQVKILPAGHACGYGCAFVAPRNMVVGIVPIGYADGFFRSLSNRACLRIGTHPAPIIGRVSMDQTVIDLTHVPNPAEGTLVTIVDDQPESPCSAQALARLAGTITYEVLTALGGRIKRVFID